MATNGESSASKMIKGLSEFRRVSSGLSLIRLAALFSGAKGKSAHRLMVKLILVFLLCFPLSIESSQSDMRVDAVKGDVTRQIDEIYGTGNLLLLALLKHSNTRIYKWEIGSNNNVASVGALDRIGSIEALHGNGSLLWLGSREGGVYSWNQNSSESPKRETTIEGLVEPAKVEALFWDGSTLWIGTGSGLLRWEPGTSNPVRAYNTQSKVKSIHGIDSRLLIGTESGLHVWDKQEQAEPERIPLGDELDQQAIRALHVANKRIYFGTDNGLFRMNKEPHGDPERVRLNVGNVKSLFATTSTLWVGTKDGLFRVNGIDSGWNAQIQITNDLSQSIETDDPILIKWKISDYAARTSPELVEQKIVVYDGEGKKFRETEVPQSQFEITLAPIEKSGDYTFEILARDLGGEVSPSKTVSFTVISAAATSRIGQVLKTMGLAWLFHVFFWALLLIGYPRSHFVQAAIFWNPKLRNYLALWYIKLILLWVRPLHRLLLRPFQGLLKADAALESFNKDTFFQDLHVTEPGLPLDSLSKDQTRIPIDRALGSMKGKFILQGESGLGKTMYARWLLVAHSERISIFLRAEQCQKGVIEAIKSKLADFVDDKDDFLRQLIFSGDIDVYIDGLNEVSPDVREKVCSFVEQSGACNILVTMQPLQWHPPKVARVYQLLPLSHDAIKQFLIKQASRMFSDLTDAIAKYEHKCDEFLHRALSEQLTTGEREYNRAILSNPMDLTIVALLLAQDKEPDLRALQEQRYREMSEYHSRNNSADPFPLDEFVELAYQVLVSPDRRLNTNNQSALESLLAYKMVVRRKVKSPEEAVTEEWRFRHDTVIDFFAVKKFLPKSYLDKSSLLWSKHIGDPRFRGIYLLLASTLSPKDATALSEKVHRHAIETGDHTLSDEYFRRLYRRIPAAASNPSNT